jgi:hypothetical protein
LYDWAHDPFPLRKVAGQPRSDRDQADLRARLDRWMRDTADPGADEADDRWDAYPYLGPPAPRERL